MEQSSHESRNTNRCAIETDAGGDIVPQKNFQNFMILKVFKDNYVGKHSSLSSLDDDYLGSLEGWLEHLQTGKSAYVDAVSREQTEISLIADIRKYYQNEAEERR